MSDLINNIIDEVLKKGAFKANVISTDEVVTDRSFRDICATNSCGMYGSCYACPPDCGDIDKLMEELHTYKYMLLYQTVYNLEDSFDFEGMQEAARLHNLLVKDVRDYCNSINLENFVALGSGGCRMCEKCEKKDNLPCRFPDKKLVSLEAYGVYVSKTAQNAGMKYINGKDTVTFFGGILFN